MSTVVLTSRVNFFSVEISDWALVTHQAMHPLSYKPLVHQAQPLHHAITIGPSLSLLTSSLSV
jgi:hypothetical protein